MTRLPFLSVAALALLGLIALAAPLLPLPNPVTMDVAHRLAGPGAGHILGQDEFGRDELARLIWGARTSLAVALIATLIACVIGTALGLVGGLLRGIAELLAVRSMDVVLCFPPLLLAVLVVTLAGPGTVTLIAVLSVLFLPGFVRVAYAGVLTTRQLDYVEALRVLGANHDGSSHGVWTERVGVLTTDFFVGLADTDVEWTPADASATTFVGQVRGGGAVRTATRHDLVFGSNAQLRSIADVYAARDGHARFVADFVRAWDKVMMLDRFDVKGHKRYGPIAA